MTKNTKIAAALVNFAKVYRSYAEMIKVAGDINIAVQFATQDMFNQIKHLDVAVAIASINEETDYLQGKVTA